MDWLHGADSSQTLRQESRRESPPANQREYEMDEHLIFLPLIIVILEIKIKVMRKRKVRKKR